jgi:hypothetical protein
MVYVGKAAGFHTRTQEEIHALLQARARRAAPRAHALQKAHTCAAVAPLPFSHARDPSPCRKRAQAR